jgi:hypothetical protein
MYQSRGGNSMKLNYGWDEIQPYISELLPIIIPVLLVMSVMMAVAIINLIKKELPFKDKVVWLIIILLVSPLGPIIYFAVGSKTLDEKIEKEGHNK